MPGAVPNWSGFGVNSLNGSSAQFKDPSTGRAWRSVFSTGGFDSQGNADQGTLAGYVSTDGKPWYQGQVGESFDAAGNDSGSFVVQDFNASDPMEKLINVTVTALVLAAAAGAAGFLGPDAAFGAGGSLGGSQVAVADSLLPGESLVSSGSSYPGYSFGVNQTAADLATGVHVSGVDLAAINVGLPFTTPSVMAPAVPPGGASAPAGAAGPGGSGGSALSSIAGYARQALGFASALGLGASGGPVADASTRAPGAPTARNNNLILLALGAAVFFAVKKG
jgi:hypothetical protein